MNINRYNYEEFFLLYIDNELDTTERKAVENFVERNADLKKELLTLQQSTFSADKNVVFKDKGALRQYTSNEQRINPNNYEQFFIDYSDDELSHKEKAAVELFVYRHPQFQEEFELIQGLRLLPDLSVTFPDKKALCRFEKEQKPVSHSWWRIAAAAVVLLIAGSLWLNNDPFSRTVKPVTKVTISKHPEHLPKAITNKSNPQIKSTAIPESNPIVDVKTNNDEQTLSARIKLESSRQKKNYIYKVNESKYSNNQVSSDVNSPIKHETATMVKAIIKQPINTELASDKTSEPSAAGKTIIDQPILTDELISRSNDVIYVSTLSSKDENTFLTNIPIDSRSSLRRVFRKASRLIEKTTALRSGRKSGILIGNIEIALQ